MTAYRNYHPNFRKRRAECLAEFDNKCMRCGVENRTIGYNSEGEIYIIYLHIAHVFRHEKMLEDCYIIPLCPTCHWFLDHPRTKPPGSISDWSFIGVLAKHFIEKESQEIEKQRRAKEQAELAQTVVASIEQTTGERNG